MIDYASMKQPVVRTRFAPSPTGYLHIGGLRTALYAYAWAKKHGGQFLLRIEDTDQARYVPEAVEQIVRSLAWVGINPDEGVVGYEQGKEIQKGEHGPYVQSQRIDLYQKSAQKLLDEKKAYWCFCTPERLEEMRKVQMASKQMPKYDRHCYGLTAEQIEEKRKAGVPGVVRFFVPDGGPVFWNDAVFGKVSFSRDQLDDFVMMKADHFPTYNFANVVDDCDMRISHVIRAYEFLSSTPKHLLLYEAFGVPAPVFAHASHILGKDKKKLSKRHAAVSVDEYRKAGYLPQALTNFIALLGWTHPDQKDVFSMDEFVTVFDIESMHKTGAVFDTEKSLWMNGQYIRALPAEAFTDLALPFLQAAGLIRVEAGNYTNVLANKPMNKKDIQAILSTEQSRVRRLDAIAEAVRFFFEPTLRYDKTILVWKKGKLEDVPTILAGVIESLRAIDAKQWTAETIQKTAQDFVASKNLGVGDVFWPFRVALTGRVNSPSPQDVAVVLGKDESIKRLEQARGLFA